jgi:hypothetical protein
VHDQLVSSSQSSQEASSRASRVVGAEDFTDSLSGDDLETDTSSDSSDSINDSADKGECHAMIIIE